MQTFKTNGTVSGLNALPTGVKASQVLCLFSLLFLLKGQAAGNFLLWIVCLTMYTQTRGHCRGGLWKISFWKGHRINNKDLLLHIHLCCCCCIYPILFLKKKIMLCLNYCYSKCPFLLHDVCYPKKAWTWFDFSMTWNKCSDGHKVCLYY